MHIPIIHPHDLTIPFSKKSPSFKKGQPEINTLWSAITTQQYVIGLLHYVEHNANGNSYYLLTENRLSSHFFVFSYMQFAVK